MLVAIVTGASSGIGKALSKTLHDSGYRVYNFSRRKCDDKNIISISTDVSNIANVQESVQKVIDTEGKIDILINCAGFGISGAIEFTDIDTAKDEFNVNFFGMCNVCKEVIPYMRHNKSGKIINISSVAAVCPIAFQAYYSASKSAINTYSMALANELRPFNIQVTSIMPGDINTGFTVARNKIIQGDTEYYGKISKSVSKMEQDEKNGMNPDTIACKIQKIINKKRLKPLYAIGVNYKLACIIMKILPSRLSNYILGKLYA